MTKKIALLFAKASVSAGLTHPEDLVSLLNDTTADIVVDSVLLDDLLYSFDGEQADIVDIVSGHSLSDYDAVYFRYWGQLQGHALATARFCQLRDIPFVDSEVLRTGSQNKITQYMNLYAAKVPIPKTLIGTPEMLQKYYKQHGFAFPLIAKSISGTRGLDNFKLDDETAMSRIFAAHSDKTFVLQSFIPNDGDYRVVVMGGRVVMVIERKASGDSHLNNTSQGGSAQLISAEDVPEDVRAMAVRAAAFFGREIAGVDIVRSSATGEYYCFEVNRSPQIEHASFEREKARVLADYLATL